MTEPGITCGTIDKVSNTLFNFEFRLTARYAIKTEIKTMKHRAVPPMKKVFLIAVPTLRNASM